MQNQEKRLELAKGFVERSGIRYIPAIENDKDVLSSTFFVLIALNYFNVVEHSSVKVYLEIATDMLRLLPDNAFSEVGRVSKKNMASTMLCKGPLDYMEHPEYRQVLEMVVLRTSEISEGTEGHWTLSKALKKGASLSVIKKLVNMATAKFEWQLIDWGIDRRETGALIDADGLVNVYPRYNKNAYTDEEIKQIRQWIKARYEHVKTRAKPIMYGIPCLILSIGSLLKMKKHQAKPVSAEDLRQTAKSVKGQPDGQSCLPNLTQGLTQA